MYPPNRPASLGPAEGYLIPRPRHPDIEKPGQAVRVLLPLAFSFQAKVWE